MNDAVLLLDASGPIARITLNRPGVHHAVDHGVMTAWEAALDTLDARDDVAALILTATGSRSFCAGGDLRWFDTLKGRAAGEAMSLRMQALLHRLHTAPYPVIAAINGDAYGGGCEILTACTLRLAADHARFAFRQAVNGVVTGWGGGTRLLRLLPRGAALRLLLTSARIDAAEALTLGLVDQVFPAEALIPAAEQLAAAIAANSRASVRAFLDLVRTWDEDGPAAAAARETALFADCWVGEDFARVLARFRK